MLLPKRKYKEYTRREISLRNDDVFKIALGKNENAHLLKDFLQSILKIEITNIVVKTEVTLDKTVKNSKESRLDLLAEIDNKDTNGKSKGTFNNIINLLNLEKKVILYYIPNQKFYQFKTMKDLNNFLNTNVKLDSKLEKLLNKRDINQFVQACLF